VKSVTAHANRVNNFFIILFFYLVWS